MSWHAPSYRIAAEASDHRMAVARELHRTVELIERRRKDCTEASEDYGARVYPARRQP